MFQTFGTKIVEKIPNFRKLTRDPDVDDSSKFNLWINETCGYTQRLIYELCSINRIHDHHQYSTSNVLEYWPQIGRSNYAIFLIWSKSGAHRITGTFYRFPCIYCVLASTLIVKFTARVHFGYLLISCDGLFFVFFIVTGKSPNVYPMMQNRVRSACSTWNLQCLLFFAGTVH